MPSTGWARALTELFGPEVAVAVWGVDVTEAGLFPMEGEAVDRAVEKRRVEFARGRSCARAALVAAGGGEPVAIPVGPDREPRFPPGWVGSITHCDGFVAAAVARVAETEVGARASGSMRARASGSEGAREALGIDAERIAALEDGVVDMILTGHDPDARTSTEMTCVVFSAKEAVFKAVFPLTRRWIGFEEVGLDVSSDGSFSVGWTAPSVDVPELARLEGRWRVVDDLVVTGCWV